MHNTYTSQSGMVPGVPKSRCHLPAVGDVGVVHSIASYDEKSAAQGAKKGRFCMGILVTLSLSTENAPRAEKIFLLIRWSQSSHRSLSLKGLKKKVNRGFITDTNQIRPFRWDPPYVNSLLVFTSC